MSITIRRLTSSATDFWSQLEKLLAWESVADAKVTQTVRDIIADVRARGDAAVLDYTRQFDRLNATNMTALRIEPERLVQALANIPAATRDALHKAAQRVRRYHEQQTLQSWSYQEADCACRYLFLYPILC